MTASRHVFPEVLRDSLAVPPLDDQLHIPAAVIAEGGDLVFDWALDRPRDRAPDAGIALLDFANLGITTTGNPRSPNEFAAAAAAYAQACGPLGVDRVANLRSMPQREPLVEWRQ